MAKEKKSVYEKINQITDLETGVIVTEKQEFIKIQEGEPEFIKLYLDCVCTFKGLNKALSPILIAFCSYMTWADDERKKQLIFMNSYTKTSVANKLGIGIDRVNKALADIVKADIFRRVGRGVYEVNPYIIAKGKWSDIKELRATFDFSNGTIEPTIEEIKKEDVNDYLATGTE